jgi:hypothetical protein
VIDKCASHSSKHDKPKTSTEEGIVTVDTPEKQEMM